MSLRLLLTLIAFNLSLSTCDRSTAETVQGEQELGREKQSLSGEINRSQQGSLMPAMNIDDPNGKTLNLGALGGGPVMISLWATWCAPCIAEMPQIDALAAEYDGRLRVVMVSQDLQKEKKVVPFFAKQQFERLEPWMDRENALGFALKGNQLPLTVLYDASGEEVWRIEGAYDWSSAAIREEIEASLQ